MAEIPFTLDQLRILKAIVDEGSFKKAADSLFVTQPAVSLQVQNLEKQLDIAIIGGQLPLELNELLEVIPFATDELALVLPTNHPLAKSKELTKEDLYSLGFITLDTQSTTRKVVDQLLSSSGLDVQRLHIEMELNSLEAIKNAVQSDLGAAFLPVVSIERELLGGSLYRPIVADLEVKRELKVITNPGRYSSRAAEAFTKDILPLFASSVSPLFIRKA